MNKSKALILLSVVASSLGIAFGASSCGQPKDEGIVIRFWHTFGHEQKAKVEELAVKFSKMIEETEDVKVTIKATAEGNYDDIQKKVLKTFSSSQNPTIAVAYPDNVAAYLERERKQHEPGKYVVNLETLINDPEIGLTAEPELCDVGYEDFLSSYREEGEHYIWDGVYSLPYMKSTEVMFYNPRLVGNALTNLGKDTSNVKRYMDNLTWDQWMELLNEFNDNRETYGLVSTPANPAFPLAYDSDGNLFISQCFQRGIPYIDIDENGKPQILFNNDEAKAMLKELNALATKGILTTKGVQGKYLSTMFTQKKCVFSIGSTAGTGHQTIAGEAIPPEVCKIPYHKSATTPDRQKYVSQGVTLCLLNNNGVSKEENDLKVKYGWKFLKYLTNTQNSTDMALISNGYVPSRISAMESEDYQYLLEDTDLMAKTAKLVTKQMTNSYFNYPVFAGSADARDNVEKLVKKTLQNPNITDKLLNDFIEEAHKLTVAALPEV